jgi:hypothetical protein
MITIAQRTVRQNPIHILKKVIKLNTNVGRPYPAIWAV